MRVYSIHQSVQNWHPVTEIGYNECITSGSRQCILGQGKLVMVLVHLTLCKIIKHDFYIYFRLSTWEYQDCQVFFAQMSLKWHMDISKILFTLSCVKYKQFDVSLLINGKPTERKVFLSML